MNEEYVVAVEVETEVGDTGVAEGFRVECVAELDEVQSEVVT